MPDPLSSMTRLALARMVVPDHRQPDDVVRAGVLDRVLQQRVEGEPEALAVGVDRGPVELAELPAPLRRRAASAAVPPR